MTPTAKLTEHLLSLPCEDRIRIVESLLESLSAPADADIEKAWSTEVERRIDELDSGTTQLIPGEEVFTEIRERFGR